MGEEHQCPAQEHHRHRRQGQRQQGVGRGLPGQHHLKGQHRDLTQQKHQHPGAEGHLPQKRLDEPGEQHEGRGRDHHAPQGLPAQKGAHHHPGPGEDGVHPHQLRRRHAGKAEGGAILPHPGPAQHQAPQEGAQLQDVLRRIPSLSLSAHGPIVLGARGDFSANPAGASVFLPDRMGRSLSPLCPLPPILPCAGHENPVLPLGKGYGIL